MSRELGSGTIGVRVTGVDGIRKALRPWLEPELTQVLDRATRAAAGVMAKAVRAEAAPRSRHMARAVRVRRARTGRPGWVVGGKRRTAFFWHMVIGGTRSHGPRKANELMFVPNWNPYIGASSKAPVGGARGGWVRVRSVRGVPADDIVERAARKSEQVAFERANRYFGELQ